MRGYREFSDDELRVAAKDMLEKLGVYSPQRHHRLTQMLRALLQEQFGEGPRHRGSGE